MKLNFGVKSLLLFALSILFLVLLTLFESSFTGVSNAMERAISFMVLVLPGIIGIIFGCMGAARKESRIWIAYLGILFNSLVALFHLFVLSFAG